MTAPTVCLTKSSVFLIIDPETANGAKCQLKHPAKVFKGLVSCY